MLSRRACLGSTFRVCTRTREGRQRVIDWFETETVRNDHPTRATEYARSAVYYVCYKWDAKGMALPS